MSEEWKAQYNKAGRLWFWGVDVQEHLQGNPWSQITPLRMSGFLPHDLCHGRNSSRWLPADFGSWWWKGRPGVLRFMGLQRVGHHWATEVNWTELHSNMYMSIPVSRFTLPSFLPGNCKLIFYICDSRHLTFKMIIRFHISHTAVFILSSVGTLPLCLWYWLQFGNQEGSHSVHGLLPGWGSWEVCWLFPEIPTFYPCDTQIVPLLYSGL